MALATHGDPAPGFQTHPWRRLVVWLVAVAMLAGGCTTMKSKELPPEALQAQIRNGSIVQAGDDVIIVTKDGNEHTLKVSAVGTDAIVGTLDGDASVTIPIDDVLALRTREVSVGRTALAGVSVYLVVGGILLVLAMEDVMDAFVDALFGGLSD